MKTVNRKILHEQLTICQKVAPHKSNMPVLSTVKMSFTQNQLILQSTDLEIGYTGRVPYVDTPDPLNAQRCHAPKGTPGICVSLSRLMPALKAIPKKKDTVSLELLSDHEIKIAGTITIICGIPVDEFPTLGRLPFGRWYDILDLDALKRVSPCMTKEGMVKLAGVYFDFNHTNLVATDGHRLHMATLDRAPCSNFFMPYGAVKFLTTKAIGKQVTGKIQIRNNKNMFVQMQNGWFVIRGLETRHPDYLAALPDRADSFLLIPDKQDFADCVNEAYALGNERYRGIKLALNCHVTITATNPDVGTFEKNLPGNFVYRGPDVNIGYNPKYFLDAIQEIEDQEILLTWGNPDGPCVMENYAETFKALVMPMRV